MRQLATAKKGSNNDALTCEPLREKIDQIAASAEALGMTSLPSVPDELIDDPVFVGLESFIVKSPSQAMGTNIGQKAINQAQVERTTKGLSNSSGGVKSLTSLTSLPKGQLRDDYPNNDTGREWERGVEKRTKMALGQKPAEVAAGTTTEQAAGAATTPQAEGNAAGQPQATMTKAERLKAQNAARKANLDAKKDAKAKEPKAPREKKAKVLGPCLDGCGQEVGGRFAVGHDAKLKSLLTKVERGELGTEAIPEVAQPYIKIKKGEKMTEEKNGQKITTQLFEVIQSPVRFPGRPEIVFVEKLEDGR